MNNPAKIKIGDKALISQIPDRTIQIRTGNFINNISWIRMPGGYMPRPRTKVLSKKEMGIWISGYHKGLSAGVGAVGKALKEIKRLEKIDKMDNKSVMRKFR